MAPQKRRNRDEDEEIIGVETATSSLRQESAQKKQRLSVNQNNSKSRNARDRSPASSSDESSSDEELPDAEDEPARPAATQYEEIRDADWEHLAHAEADDHRATQRFLSRKERIGDNHAANNAIIEEITCINFMCHDKLHVELGPLINFIVGMNGSGKSAVLTAITLCLGGKASSTNRGSSMKSLVKQGKDQGILIVKLKNQGNDAYQTDVFGASIIIERHFAKTGSTSYKLKNANGRIISTKKADVDDIIEYYQLQVDNPMNVLTQDAAKSFIQSSTPAKKYEFFHEGVQLQTLDNDYKIVLDTCDSIQAKLDESLDDLQVLKKKNEAAKKKAEIVQQHEGMRQERKSVARRHAWAQVEEMEQKLIEREHFVEQMEEQIQKAQQKADEKTEDLQQADLVLERAKETASRVEGEISPIQEELETAKIAYDNAAKEVKKAQTEAKQIVENLRIANRNVKNIEEAIQTEMQRIENANGGAHTRKLQELENAEHVSRGAREALEQHNTEIPRLESEKMEAQELCRNAVAPFEAKSRELAAAREELQGMNLNRADTMAGFHPNLGRVLNIINQDRGFREKPVGPVGLHCKVLNPDWAPFLESQYSGPLNHFVVTSKADQSRLYSILRQNNMGFMSIGICSRDHIDVNGHEPDPQYETVLRALEIDDELVKKYLIITQAIEQTLLIPTRAQAIKVMFEGPKPFNVKQAFCHHDRTRGASLRVGWGRSAGSREISPVEPPKGRPKMKSDIESRITYQRETVSQLEREKHVLEDRRRQLTAVFKRCEQAIEQHKKSYSKLKLASQRADEKVDSIKAELDGFEVEDGRLDGMKAQLEEAQAEVTICEEAYGNAGLEKQELNKKSADKKKELEAVRARLAEFETQLQKAKDKVKNREQARKHILMEKNNAFEAIEPLRAAKAKGEEKAAAQAENVISFTAQAAQVCARVSLEPGDTVQGLDARLNSLNNALEAYKKAQGGTDEQIYNAAVEADRIWKKAVSQRIELQELFQLLKQSFLQRIDMYRRFQRHISSRSRINFNYLLSERAFRGKLTIDHKAKKLDVHVEPDETTKSGKGRQTKTLSGGEKSFSSICLLLSLWEAMGAPLRCLDEFDVFMDDVNRDVSTRMIISAARRSVGRQFVLITPKALGAAGATAAPDVKIIKLDDPRDKQRKINNMLVSASQ